MIRQRRDLEDLAPLQFLVSSNLKQLGVAPGHSTAEFEIEIKNSAATELHLFETSSLAAYALLPSR